MSRQHHYFVYILACAPFGTLHVGVTNDLVRRMHQHREGLGGEFRRRYDVHRLGYFEFHQDINEPINREKALKRWRRDRKTNLIEHENPHWDDLLPGLMSSDGG